jgi:hypothetical protein
VNGGWANYSKSATHPYISLHAMQALLIAKANGFSVTERVETGGIM